MGAGSSAQKHERENEEGSQNASDEEGEDGEYDDDNDENRNLVEGGPTKKEKKGANFYAFVDKQIDRRMEQRIDELRTLRKYVLDLQGTYEHELHEAEVKNRVMAKQNEQLLQGLKVASLKIQELESHFFAFMSQRRSIAVHMFTHRCDDLQLVHEQGHVLGRLFPYKFFDPQQPAEIMGVTKDTGKKDKKEVIDTNDSHTKLLNSVGMRLKNQERDEEEDEEEEEHHDFNARPIIEHDPDWPSTDSDTDDDDEWDASKGVLARDWNDEYQQILSSVSKSDNVLKYESYFRLFGLLNDFLQFVKHYGEIIISEYRLPYESKSIKPTLNAQTATDDKSTETEKKEDAAVMEYLSEQAKAMAEKIREAGTSHSKTVATQRYKEALNRCEEEERRQKAKWKERNKGLKAMKGARKLYLVHNILFVVAAERHNFYGSVEHAMKAAGHELKSLAAYQQLGMDSLSLPLATLLDYRGHRLLAVAVIPEARPRGTDPKNIQRLRVVMRQAAGMLNVAHHTFPVDGTEEECFGPADMVGHVGVDGRIYIVNLARVFPPTPPERHATAKSHLVKLFRPEFVERFPVPLCSDVFSGFCRDEDLAHTDQAREAFNRLRKNVIPAFAAFIGSHIDFRCDASHLVHLLHRFGINVRYMGLLRLHVKEPIAKTLLLLEMLARVLKRELQYRMRDALSTKNTSIQPLQQEIAHFFNLVFLEAPVTYVYWTNDLREMLMAKFVWALSDTELVADSRDASLITRSPTWSQRIDRHLLLQRLCELTGVAVDERSLKLYARGQLARFWGDDITGISSSLEHYEMFPNDFREGVQSLNRALKSEGNMREQDRFFEKAAIHFREALKASPSNVRLLCCHGDVLLEHGKAKTLRHSVGLWKLAESKYKEALAIQPDSTEALMKIGDLYVEQAERCLIPDEKLKLLLSAGKMYFEAISLFWFNTRQRKFAFAWLLRLRRVDLPWFVKATHHLDRSLCDFDFSVCNSIADGSIQLFLKNTSYLTGLDVSNCHVTDETITLIADTCPKLRQLSLRNCSQVTDFSVEELTGQCTQLTSIDLSGCFMVTDEALSSIAEVIANELTLLRLDGCIKCSEIGLRKVGKECGNLTDLDVSRVNVTNTAIQDWAVGCSSLTRLHLSECGDTNDTSMVMVGRLLSSLTDLDLAYCTQVSATAIVGISQTCRKLVALTLTDCINVNDVAVMHVGRFCTSLESLNLNGCRNVSSHAVLDMSRHVTALTDLGLAGCNEVNDAAVKSLAHGCTNLKSLHLGFCSLVTSSAVIQLSRLCTHLTNLNCAGLVELDDHSLKAISMSLTRLTSLDISGCEQLTDSNSKLVGQFLTNLQSLNLFGCTNVGDQTVLSVAAGCPALRELRLGSHAYLGDYAVNTLVNSCPQLLTLTLSGCPALSPNCKDVIRNERPWMSVV